MWGWQLGFQRCSYIIILGSVKSRSKVCIDLSYPWLLEQTHKVSYSWIFIFTSSVLFLLALCCYRFTAVINGWPKVTSKVNLRLCIAHIGQFFSGLWDTLISWNQRQMREDHTYWSYIMDFQLCSCECKVICRYSCVSG